jgi:hypothetical protein
MLKKITFFLKKHWPFLLLLLLSLGSVWALLVPGFFGSSDDMHPAWLYELDQAVRLGQIPPRFVPDLSFGFGYPLFNFVFPLPFYLGELFHLLGLSLVDSIKAVFGLSMILSAVTMYYFLKEFTSKTLSATGALIYTYTPYRATDLYVRGAIGEVVSFVFLPLLALSVVKLTPEKSNQKFNWRWIGFLGLSLSALVLSHNITAYMFFPFVLLLGLMRLIFLSDKKTQVFKNLMAGGFLGLSISIYFWLPAIWESSLMKYDTVFNFIDHFPTLKQLVTPFWGYGASVPGPYDGMSFFLGLASLFTVLGGLIFFIIRRGKFTQSQSLLMIWALVSFGIAIVMMNFRSTFLWQNIPLLPYFQFPWRFLMMTTFVTPILVIALTKIRYEVVFALLLMGLSLLNLGDFRPHDFLGRTDQYYLNRYVPVPLASLEYLTTSEEYLRLPKATTQRPNSNYPLIQAEGQELSTQTFDGLNAKFSTSFNKETQVSYNKYLFPGWKVTIDGKEVKALAGSPYGEISFSVPAGEHQVTVNFEETGVKRALDLISLLGLVASLLMMKQGIIFKGRR